MPRVTVSAGARVHAGFCNLSLARERLYGGVGFALREPRATVTAEPAAHVERDGNREDADPFREYAERACDLLDLPGARVTVEERLPQHVGLGSGTQSALATYAAVARAHGHDPRPRKHAPALGRGGRSGVGVAGFETGGFVVDAGHPTERFTTDPPAAGDWRVPAVLSRHDLPDAWRVVLALPDAEPGRHGDGEDESMRAVVERADTTVAEDLASLLVGRLLPAAAEGRLAAFGGALAAYGRLNGAWYADVQGGVYRPPAGRLVERLAESPAVAGAGQSSWGPAVWALTDAERASEARGAAEDALADTGAAGRVLVTRPANAGARVDVAGQRDE
jgi:beta-ribofuranosylaminobenzene 5'-phosphate synthase